MLNQDRQALLSPRGPVAAVDLGESGRQDLLLLLVVVRIAFGLVRHDHDVIAAASRLSRLV